MSKSQSKLLRLRHFGVVRVCVILLLMVGSVLIQANLIVNPLTGVAQSPGDIIVSDPGALAIFRQSPSPGVPPVTIFSGYPYGTPEGVAIEASGAIIVADGGSNTRPPGIYRQPNCASPPCPPTPIITGSLYKSPQGVAIDSSGNIIVADLVAKTIFRQNPSGGTPIPISFTGFYQFPFGVAIDASGNIIVTDGIGKIFRQSNCGSPPCASTLISSTGYVTPQGVAVESSSGNIIVSDYGVPAIFRQSPIGGPPSTISSTGYVTPEGVAIDASGNIIVVDQGVPAIFRQNPLGGAPVTIFSGAPYLTPEFDAIVSVITTTTGCVQPPSGLVAWWPLDETSGATSLQDIIGGIIGGNNAMPFVSPVGAAQGPQPVTGKVNGAIDFPKFGNSLSGAQVSPQGALATIGTADFTIDAWVKFPSTPANSRHYIVNKFDFTLNNGYALYIVSPGIAGNEHVQFQGGDGSTWVSDISIVPITINQWHHVAITFARNVPGAGFLIYLYIDGAQQGQAHGPGLGSFVNSIDLELGRQPGTTDEPITIDELEIFDRALPASDIASIFNAGSAGKCPPPTTTPTAPPGNCTDLSTGTLGTFQADALGTPDTWSLPPSQGGPPVSVTLSDWAGGPGFPDPRVGTRANWISPSQYASSNQPTMGAPAGQYTYTRTFYAEAGWILTVDALAADNYAKLYLDGISPSQVLLETNGLALYGDPSVGFKHAAGPASRTVPLPSGQHSLIAQVGNAVSYTGLLVIAEVCPSSCTDLSTGTSGDYVADAPGTSDSLWTVTAAPSLSVYDTWLNPTPGAFSITPNPNWVGSPSYPNAQVGTRANWIFPYPGISGKHDPYGNVWPQSQVAPVGSYVYKRSFTVPSGWTTPVILTIYGYTSDNNMNLLLDGSVIANLPSTTGFSTLYGPVSVPVPQTPNPHTLEADVYNTSNFTGILIIADVCACNTTTTQTTTITSGSTSLSTTTSTVSGGTVTSTSTSYSTTTQQLTTTATTTMTGTSYTTETASGVVDALTQTTSTATATMTTLKTVVTVTSTTTIMVRTGYLYTTTRTYTSLTMSTSTISGVYTETSTYTYMTTTTSTFGNSTITATTTILYPGSTVTRTTTSTRTCPQPPCVGPTCQKTSQSSSTTTRPSSGPKCIIATAAYGSELAIPVQFLRSFRDNEVQKTSLGSAFMTAFNNWYYSWAPSIAQQIAPNEDYKSATRAAITPLIGTLFAAHALFATLAPLSPELAVVSVGLLASALIGLIYLTPAYALAWKLSKRRITNRTIYSLAIAAAAITFTATLTTGTFNLAANLTALTVVETLLLAPVLVLQKITSRFLGKT